KIGALLAEANFHARLSVHILAVPIRNIVLRGAGRDGSGAINSSKILGLGGKAGVLSAADDKDRANRPNKPCN
ncbi:MAG: hypothetical protein DME32_01260, partial [Verrucomicrobia bacterium]